MGVDIFNFKWNDAFENETELVNKMMIMDIETYKNRWLKAPYFIKSLQEQIKRRERLSKKQMTQLKRLAKEIYKYHYWTWS